MVTRVSTRVVVTARRAGTALVPTDSRIGARAIDDEDQAWGSPESCPLPPRFRMHENENNRETTCHTFSQFYIWLIMTQSSWLSAYITYTHIHAILSLYHQRPDKSAHAHLFISSVVTWYWYLLSSLQSSSSSISLKLWQSLTKYLKTNIKHHMHDFVQVFPRPLVLLHIQNPLALPHVLNPLVLLHVLTPLVLFDVLSLLLFLLVLVVTSSPGHSKFWILPYSHMVWDTALSLASHCTGFRHLSVLGRSRDVFIQSSECCE